MNTMTSATHPLLSQLFGDRGTKAFFGVLLATVVIVPILHLAVAEGSALHLSSYTMTLIGKYMTYALLAIAVDLV
ncbi:MAG: urea ABC transporter permease subunit UrtC, partial [Xanthomonadaceae bacterium]|nr:urea ABC transporter permease subunit UrtC [Xanthomonadaceae bacterium]